MGRARYASVMELRQITPQPLRGLAGVFTIALVLLVWWFVTSGMVNEERIVSPAVLPSPGAVGPLPGTVHEVEAVAADGARVQSWLVLPEGASVDEPAPLVLWIHGGPLMSWNSWSWRWCPWVMVARGYAVLLPNPALSQGFGLDFVRRGWGEWGAAPYTDLMAAGLRPRNPH